MKNLIYITLSVFMLVSLSGCFDDAGTEVLLNQNQVTIADGSETGGNERRIVVIPDGELTQVSIKIELIGPALNSDVSVTIGVNAGESSAIEGVDVTFPDGKSVVIPAGSFQATLPMDVNDDNLDPENPLNIVLEITDASISVNENYKSLNLALVGICPPELFDYTTMVGTYTVTSSGESTDGCPANNPMENFVYDGVELSLDPDNPETDEDITFIMSEAFGGMYIEWYGDCYGYTFETPERMVIEKETGSITIMASSAFTGDAFEINGAIDPCNGNFATSWTNAFDDTGENSYVQN